MQWEQLVQAFCQQLAIPVSQPIGAVMQVNFNDESVLQLERLDNGMIIWLSHVMPEYQKCTWLTRAMQLTYSGKAPFLPLRCSCLPDKLLLSITLPQEVQMPLLYQAWQLLLMTQREVTQHV